MLRFTRGRRPLTGLIAAFVAFYLAVAISWRGLVPVPGALYLAVAIMISAAMVPQYLVDRLLAPRIGGFLSTLVFPLAWVSAEYANSRLSPYGTWGAAAYTQVHDLPLMQIVAVAGIYGAGFLVAWLASVANWAWERGFDGARTRAGIVTFVSVLALVHLLGGVRLLRAPSSETVRVASFTVAPSPPLDPFDLLRRPHRGAALDTVRRVLRVHQDSLLAWSRREARAGAKLVFWSEANALVLRDQEADFISRGAAVAREEGIQLAMAMATFMPGEGYYENQLILLDPRGEVAARYHKARPVPGDPERGADRHLPVIETAFGRLAGAICFDMDFPELIRDAGRAHAGILIAPSSDWRDIDPIHTRMALVRGIENGCAVVRQTNKGLSAAADAWGRTLAQVDYFQTRPSVMVAQVPVRGAVTPYARVGDLFAWICIVALVMLAAFAARQAPADVP